MTDYLNMDIASLTVEDARNDAEWGKRPVDVCRFLGVDMPVLDSFADFTDGEIAEIMRVMRAFCLDGIVPDYSALSTSAVKLSIRSLVASHTQRIESEYLKAYKSYAGAKQNQAKQRAFKGQK